MINSNKKKQEGKGVPQTLGNQTSKKSEKNVGESNVDTSQMKQCAVCLTVLPKSKLVCPNCGRSSFLSNKSHYIRENWRNDEMSYDVLYSELRNIAESSYTESEGYPSYFYIQDGVKNPRVQEIGNALYRMEGNNIRLMLSAHDQIVSEFDENAGRKLSIHWHGIGGWLH